MNYNRIRTLADEKKVNYSELSRKIGISYQGFNKMIKNRNMTISTLEKICEVLKIPINVFFDEDFVLKQFNEKAIKYSNLEDKNPFSNAETELIKRIKILEAENIQLRNELNEAKDKIIKLLENK